MNDIVTVLDSIKQVSVPSIIAGTMALTDKINGTFNIQNNNMRHIMSISSSRFVVNAFVRYV